MHLGIELGYYRIQTASAAGFHFHLENNGEPQKALGSALVKGGDSEAPNPPKTSAPMGRFKHKLCRKKQTFCVERHQKAKSKQQTKRKH